MISTHGGVLPWCVQGSKVVYSDAPEQFFTLFKALNSEWGLPFKDVTPDDITVLFLTTTDPTEGFNLVLPKFISANLKARSR